MGDGEEGGNVGYAMSERVRMRGVLRSRGLEKVRLGAVLDAVLSAWQPWTGIAHAVVPAWHLWDLILLFKQFFF